MLDSEGSIPKHGYMPCSTGPRICLGNAFTMLQLRITLITVLQCMWLTAQEDYTLEPNSRFNTRPRDGMPMRVTVRSENA